MNVNDLIACLEKWDGDMPVCVAQSDGTGLLLQSADWADHNEQGPVILLSPFASLESPCATCGRAPQACICGRTWEERVRCLESQGLTRSDAQAVVDAEDAKEGVR